MVVLRTRAAAIVEMLRILARGYQSGRVPASVPASFGLRFPGIHARMVLSGSGLFEAFEGT